jgi:hypothetical protein
LDRKQRVKSDENSRSRKSIFTAVYPPHLRKRKKRFDSLLPLTLTLSPLKNGERGFPHDRRLRMAHTAFVLKRTITDGAEMSADAGAGGHPSRNKP